MEEMPSDISEESVEWWTKYGFLEGLDGDTRHMVAAGYEQAAWLVLHKDWHKHGWRLYGEIDRISCVIFPVVRRIITGVGEPVDIAELWDSFLSFCKVFDQTVMDVVRLKAHDNEIDMDVEAQLVYLFCVGWIMKHDCYKIVREETV